MKSGSNGTIRQGADPNSALFFVNSDTASYGGVSYHDEWFRQNVVVTSGGPVFKTKLSRIPQGARVLVYVNGVGVVSVGEIISNVITEVTNPDTINPLARIEYHRPVSWRLDLRNQPIRIQQLRALIGWNPPATVQQIHKGKHALLGCLAIHEAVPTPNMTSYLRIASELFRYGPVAMPEGTLIPPRINLQGTYFSRDPRVRAWTLQRANGHCELCKQPAPFLDEFQVPYLESHHIDMLSAGGADTPENTAALCANCHRELHFGVESSTKSAQLRAIIAAS